MKRKLLIGASALLLAAFPFLFLDSKVSASVLAIALVCLFLWLLELTPSFVPTLLLWFLVPVVLSPFDPRFSVNQVLDWAADPVLALFFGGFTLGVAAHKHGLDRSLASILIGGTRGSSALLLLAAMFLTALLSMWISNIAAAALMFACIRPLTDRLDKGDLARRTLLLGVAFAANLGGIATPVGTGPNAIAIGWMEGKAPVTFLSWMMFAVPLTVGMIVLAFLLIRRGVSGGPQKSVAPFSGDLEREDDTSSPVAVVTVLIVAAALWLTEPLHHVPAAVVALAVAASLFLFGLLERDDISKIDWATLLLIAGGITLGRLLETSGVVTSAAMSIPFAAIHPVAVLFILCLTSAMLSALMSNTASVVLLIPIATAVFPEPSTAVLIAISSSFGMPFVISTPPNAMAYGEGGLTSRDLLVPGLILMIVGCAVVSLTGKTVLNFAGIP